MESEIPIMATPPPEPRFVPPHGGWCAYGWHIVDGEYVPHPQHYPILELIVRLREEKEYSLAQIAKKLNDAGITTRQGTKWSRQNLHEILKNVWLKDEEGSTDEQPE